jgi:hypothetical protein
MVARCLSIKESARGCLGKHENKVSKAILEDSDDTTVCGASGSTIASSALITEVK